MPDEKPKLKELPWAAREAILAGRGRWSFRVRYARHVFEYCEVAAATPAEAAALAAKVPPRERTRVLLTAGEMPVRVEVHFAGQWLPVSGSPADDARHEFARIVRGQARAAETRAGEPRPTVSMGGLLSRP
jgi:hypothetical protein